MAAHNDQTLNETLFPALPKSWRTERLYDVAELRLSNVDKKSAEDEKAVLLCNYVDVYKNDRITSALSFMEATAPDAQIERFRLFEGDVIITKDSESPDDIGVPSYVAETIPDLVCGYHLTILRQDEKVMSGPYLFYALEGRASAYQFYLAANGVTRYALTYQGTKNIQVAFPPLPEQRQIALFLDWKTGQIDALIAKKKRLLERLKEKRMAVITQAVTKGLNPDANMRESGIAWLGKVPRHWIDKRLRYCTSLVTSGSRGWAEYFADEGALFLRITNLDRESIDLLLNDIQRVDPPDGAEGARSITRGGDLLISITADLGSVAIVPEQLEAAYVSQHLALVRLDTDQVDSAWIAYSIFSHAGKFQMRMAGYGGTKVQLSLGDIKAVAFVHPPAIEEQQSILEHIRNEVGRINKLYELTTTAIDRLIEYRSALITNVTTGKIDVRNVKFGPVL